MIRWNMLEPEITQQEPRSDPLPYGRRIRMARLTAGMSQEQLAGRLGVTPSFVSKLENGVMRPSPRITERCGELLGVHAPAGPTDTQFGSAGACVHEPARRSLYQLDLGIRSTHDWVSQLLPTEEVLDPGPPAIYHWDIPQSIGELAYLTHNFYRYYGKFPPTIPRKLLRDYPVKPGHWILDNFGGAGTTLVEALCEGVPSIGVDVSPLATLAAQVKTCRVDIGRLGRHLDCLNEAIETCPVPLPECALPDAEYLQKWFSPSAGNQLQQLKSALLSLPLCPERSFLVLAFLAIIRRVSFAFDGEVRPHINPNKVAKEPLAAFRKKVAEMAKRSQALQSEAPADVPALAITGDNRRLQSLLDWNKYPVGLVVSHPPYLNCFDYAPVFKLEYAWSTGFAEVGEDFRYEALRTSEIRCWPATDERVFQRYFGGLRQAYSEVAALTNSGTRCCVVIGDCTIGGRVVPVLDLFTDIMRDIGFSLDRIILRSTHYGTGKYAYADRADYHGQAAKKRDGILVFIRT